MLELLLLSVPFLVLGWWGASLWTILVPVAFWLVVALLWSAGVTPAAPTFTAAVLAGAIGASCAALGMVARAQLHPRSRPRGGF